MCNLVMRYNKAMDDVAFEALVQSGIDRIPKEFIERLDNVAIVIEDEPSHELRTDIGLGDNEMLFGLYQGIPLTERGSGYSLVLPDKITIFKNPILAHAQDDDEIAELVADTVWHEIAHHFGSDEAEVRRKEAKRKREESQNGNSH